MPKAGHALSLLALPLAGCVLVPVPSETYFAQDSGNAPVMKRCAPTPLYARVFERGNVTLDVAIQEGRDFRGSWQLRGPSRFLDSQMAVREYDFARPVVIELKGCAAVMVDGVRECAFKTSFMAPEIAVSVPAFEVEGSRHELPPIRFSKRAVRSMCWMTMSELAQQ